MSTKKTLGLLWLTAFTSGVKEPIFTSSPGDYCIHHQQVGEGQRYGRPSLCQPGYMTEVGRVNATKREPTHVAMVQRLSSTAR